MTIDRLEKRAVILHVVIADLQDEGVPDPDLDDRFGPTYDWNRIAMRRYVRTVVRDLLKIFGSFDPSPFDVPFPDEHLDRSVSDLVTDLDNQIDV